MIPPRIVSALDTHGREPTSGELCAARQEADRLLAELRPAVVAMILGKATPFRHVDHVSDAGLLQVVVTRTLV